MNKRTLRITKTYYNPNNSTKEYKLLTPKTKGSIRTLKMDSGVIEVLKRHKEHQDDLIDKMKNEYTQLDFVFAKEVQTLGYPEFLKTVNTHMRRLLKIDHSLRHTHTSILIKAGVGVKEIQQRLGHRDINTTLKIYTHVTEQMKKDTSESVQKVYSHLLKYKKPS